MDTQELEALNSSLRKFLAANPQIKVMVVDDVADTRMFLRTTLERFGFLNIIGARTAVEAREKFFELSPDLIYLDIHLPDDSGIELLCKITGARPGTFVVMLTSDATAELVSTSIDYGARGYIIKPYSLEKLCESLKNFLRYIKSTKN